MERMAGRVGWQAGRLLRRQPGSQELLGRQLEKSDFWKGFFWSILLYQFTSGFANFWLWKGGAAFERLREAERQLRDAGRG